MSPLPLIDRHAAETAVALALPMLDQSRQVKAVGESGFLHIVVMDPARAPGSCVFEEAILYEYSVGDRSKWDADYAGFARAKAEVSWRSGLDSHVVQTLQPHRLNAGATLLWGSVCLDGIVVGVSGANAWYDEAFAGSIALLIRAEAKARWEQARAKGLFLG
jgi:hypothetical protein